MFKYLVIARYYFVPFTKVVFVFIVDLKKFVF